MVCFLAINGASSRRLRTPQHEVVVRPGEKEARQQRNNNSSAQLQLLASVDDLFRFRLVRSSPTPPEKVRLD